MELNDVLRQIRFGNYTNDECNKLAEAIKYRRSQLTQEKKDDLFPGLHVKFTNSRSGRVYTGTVKKINRKFVLVDTGSQLWRVPANMLDNAV
jgi:FKBP-type peptidyl-prolyl cis-trans isomerase 2